MASRSQERRKSSREPGIWRGTAIPTPEVEAARPDVQHGTRSRMLVSWRVFSSLIVMGMLVVLFLFISADAFYVHSIAVGGLQTMTKEEVFALTDIANMHLFWLDPAEIRKNILRSPTIADATVSIGWPPQMVAVVIEEREPALIWEQSGIAVWIDLQGRVMQQREVRTDLLRIAGEQVEGPLGPDVRVPVDVVNGALQLRALFPNIETLRYHPEKGLGYADGRGWEIWFGSGTNMPEKLKIYDAIVANLLSRGIQPSEINVSNPDAPFYAAAWGR